MNPQLPAPAVTPPTLPNDAPAPVPLLPLPTGNPVPVVPVTPRKLNLKAAGSLLIAVAFAVQPLVEHRDEITAWFPRTPWLSAVLGGLGGLLHGVQYLMDKEVLESVNFSAPTGDKTP